jgi:hypothetical protein
VWPFLLKYPRDKIAVIDEVTQVMLLCGGCQWPLLLLLPTQCSQQAPHKPPSCPLCPPDLPSLPPGLHLPPAQQPPEGQQRVRRGGSLQSEGRGEARCPSRLGAPVPAGLQLHLSWVAAVCLRLPGAGLAVLGTIVIPDSCCACAVPAAAGDAALCRVW